MPESTVHDILEAIMDFYEESIDSFGKACDSLIRDENVWNDVDYIPAL